EITLSASVSTAITVTYSTANGTATAGSDYTAASGSVTFAANSPAGTKKTIDVAITDDNVVESSEDFTMSLGTVSGGPVTIGTATATATITDNDVSVVTVAAT
ncbi:hypothetical protein GS399_20615, partial [Pedobacter sp. HMF7647]